MTAAQTIPQSDSLNLPLQAASQDIWQQKYRLTDEQGAPLDLTPDHSYERVARKLAQLEASPQLVDFWYTKYLWALRQGALPAGRIMANVGAEAYKPATSTINCTVASTVADSMADILEANTNSGLTLKAGCGIGYEFSTLRPKGARVAGAGAETSGPMSFMEIFDKMCATVSSAGGRRGAQMATFDIGHPDVEDFIRAKRDDGRLRQFNLSLLISDDFLEAVAADAMWPLAFPIAANEDTSDLDFDNPLQVIWRRWPTTQGYQTNNQQQVACRVYKHINATRLWNLVMSSNYDYAEPGFLLIDRINDLNNNWFCESIRATNPCGEQPLPPNGSCLLGSINLTRFVKQAFTEQAHFDWQSFREVVAIFTRMLDNVVELNGLPLAQQRHEIQYKRRHGMGFLGLGSALSMMKMHYGDEASLVFTGEVSKQLALQGYRTGLELAQEKGPAPIFNEQTLVTGAMLQQRPEMATDGIKEGDNISNKLLWSKYSRYLQRLGQEDKELQDQLSQHGCRFTHHSSIAPTGTIALSFANNASNGIEPSFAHQYRRNIIIPGKKSKMQVDVLSYERLHYQAHIGSHTEQALPDYFMDADQISPSAHIAIQAAAQTWIDSSISKTINVATDIEFDDFKQIYWQAAQQGLKGCTTFRYNPERFQGVLVKQQDQANTRYRFTLADGSQVELDGDETVVYDGEEHLASNLYEAIKEGYYGKL